MGRGREATLPASQPASLALEASFFSSSRRSGRTGRGDGGLQCTRRDRGTNELPITFFGSKSRPGVGGSEATAVRGRRRAPCRRAAGVRPRPSQRAPVGIIIAPDDDDVQCHFAAFAATEFSKWALRGACISGTRNCGKYAFQGYA